MMVPENSSSNSVTISTDHSVSCHYRNVVFYTIMSFDQNLTISQKKSPFPPDPEKEVPNTCDFGSVKLLISVPQGSVITDVSVNSEPSSLSQTQRSIYTFLQRPTLYKEILAHTVEIVSSIPVRIARPYDADVLNIFLLFQALGST